MFFTDGNEREQQVAALVQCHADGNRNLLHVCVSMCAPISNKDLEPGEPVLPLCIFICFLH